MKARSTKAVFGGQPLRRAGGDAADGRERCIGSEGGALTPGGHILHVSAQSPREEVTAPSPERNDCLLPAKPACFKSAS